MDRAIIPSIHQVFWTENHIAMSQSSELLLRDFLGLPVPPELLQRLENFLDLKLSLGMAEFLSPVYYPFTIVSLLNLYDYAMQPARAALKTRCSELLDRISHQVRELTMCVRMDAARATMPKQSLPFFNRVVIVLCV